MRWMRPHGTLRQEYAAANIGPIEIAGTVAVVIAPRGNAGRQGGAPLTMPWLPALANQGEPVLSAVPGCKARDALVVRDQRAAKLDRRRNQHTIRRVAVFEMMKSVGTRSRTIIQGHGLDAGAAKETAHPLFHRQVQIDSSGVDQQRHFPCTDGAHQNPAVVFPAMVD